ncbi:MAG: restriction endonuclease subunit S [Muribaculaceae bacterium]|nr:restriction endonuclease subunit S [Muribaculaceae bacterium]
MIPEDYIVSLADCCEILVGKNIDKKKTNNEGRGYPLIVGASDLVEGRFVPSRWCDCELRTPVYSQPGDILVSIVGTLGKIGLNTTPDALLSGHVCAIRPRSGVSGQYIMAMVSRLILDAIPDKGDDVVLGFQCKLSAETLKALRFTLPDLWLQEWLVSRLTSIANILMAYKGKKDDFQSWMRLIEVIEKERKEQKQQMRKVADVLIKLHSVYESLPQIPETAEMIAETRSTIQRLQKIQ